MKNDMLFPVVLVKNVQRKETVLYERFKTVTNIASQGYKYVISRRLKKVQSKQKKKQLM